MSFAAAKAEGRRTQGDPGAADAELCRLGLRYRLAAPLWLPAGPGPAGTPAWATGAVTAFDGALPPALFGAVRDALAQPAFWEEHASPRSSDSRRVFKFR